MRALQEAGKGPVKSAEKAAQSKEISILHLRCGTQACKKNPSSYKLFDRQKCSWKSQDDR